MRDTKERVVDPLVFEDDPSGNEPRAPRRAVSSQPDEDTGVPVAHDEVDADERRVADNVCEVVAGQKLNFAIILQTTVEPRRAATEISRGTGGPPRRVVGDLAADRGGSGFLLCAGGAGFLGCGDAVTVSCFRRWICSSIPPSVERVMASGVNSATVITSDLALANPTNVAGSARL
jgi:hypothetical protein